MSEGLRVLIGMVANMDNQPRVIREASTLIGRGDEVVALGVRIDGNESRLEVTPGGLIVRRFDLVDLRVVRWLKRITRWRPTAPSSGAAQSGPRPSGGAPTSEPAAAMTERNRLADLRTLVHLAAAFLGFLYHALRCRSDVYHAHDAPPALAFWLIARLHRASFVYETHEYWKAKLPDQPMSHWLTIRIERFVCRRADLVIAVNETISNRMAVDYAIPAPCVVLNVPQAIGLPQPAAPASDEPLRLLYHGIFVPERGIEAAIEAVASMTRPVELTLRGWGELTDDLERLIARLGVADRVRFAVPVPMHDLPAAALCDHVGLLPFSAKIGYDLALPNKLFEYMAAGLAVLSSDLIELRRIIDEERIGRLFDGSPGGLARELEWLLDHPVELLEMRTRAHSCAQQRYNWAAQENVLIEAYPDPTRLSTGGGK